MAWHQAACNGRSGWLGQTLVHASGRLSAPMVSVVLPGRMGNMGLSVSLTCQSPWHPLDVAPTGRPSGLG